jgi:hypothetical protein
MPDDSQLVLAPLDEKVDHVWGSPAGRLIYECDQKPRRSLTMITVTRPAVITLLMMRTLFTPLGTP